jgi:hypothetical protein
MSKVLCLKRAVLSALFLTLVLKTLPAGGQGPGQTMEQYKQFVEQQYLPKKQQQEQQREQEVQQFVQGQSQGGGGHWDNFHGAEKSDIDQTNQDDEQSALDVFEEANDNQLCYEQVMAEPQNIILAPGESTRQVCCEVRNQLIPGKQGLAEWGTCLHEVTPGPMVCNFCIDWTSSFVEYYHPGYKMDVSEEMYQSLYLDKQEIENTMMKENDKILYDNTKENVTATLNFVNQMTTDEGNRRGYDFGKIEGEAQGADEAAAKIKEVDKDKRHSAPHGAKAYGRIVIDTLNFKSLMYPWVPHVMKAPYYGADLPVSKGGTGEPVVELEGGFPFSRILTKSEDWFLQWNSMFNLGPFRCVKNNMITGKTPMDMIDQVSPMPDMFENCLNDIGEVFPLYDDRRPHITDGTYQAIWRALETYRGIFPEGGSFRGMVLDNEKADNDAWVALRHTYKRKYDKWQVLRGDTFKQETEQAMGKKLGFFDDLPQLNISYEQSNSKKIKSGGENNFIVWPLFKGCWGFNPLTGEPQKGVWRPPLAVLPAVPPGWILYDTKLEDEKRLY